MSAVFHTTKLALHFHAILQQYALREDGEVVNLGSGTVLKASPITGAYNLSIAGVSIAASRPRLVWALYTGKLADAPVFSSGKGPLSFKCRGKFLSKQSRYRDLLPHPEAAPATIPHGWQQELLEYDKMVTQYARLDQEINALQDRMISTEGRLLTLYKIDPIKRVRVVTKTITVEEPL